MRLGVLGWPVIHSRSPAMQNAALWEVGCEDCRYQLLPVPPDLFADLVTALRGVGFRGANVTLPHKEAALALSTNPTPRAGAIGAANTLLFEADGSMAADNTDAPALVAALPGPVEGAQALVLGAGGSARAAVWALLDAGAGRVQVWNRTPERARELCRELGGDPVSNPGPADLMVNCTSVGLNGGQALGELPLVEGQIGDYGCVVDLVYRPEGTGLVRAAHAAGVPVVDGLEILVGQGALSFELFTGRPAPVAAMRQALGLSQPGAPRADH